jgi:histidyl-tRNA synthetase
VIIYGPDETDQGLFGLKEMTTGEQTNLTKTALLERLSDLTELG